MKILQISAELACCAKVGGLADVVMGLSRELKKKHHQVAIILPRYDCLDYTNIQNLEIVQHDLWSYFKGHWHHNTVWKGTIHEVTLYLIEPHEPEHYFDRGHFYGSKDDVDRFLYFSRAALEFVLKSELQPDVIHIHDWQTAAIAPLFNDIYKPLGISNCKIIFTIHNLEYQGRCRASNLTHVGLDPALYESEDKLKDPYYAGDFNLLKGGIVYADSITTVSPNYAEEALTADGGKGLETILKTHQNKFYGILNGIDTDYWNPEKDSYLHHHFSSRKVTLRKKEHPAIEEKEKIKEHLRQILSLNQEKRPLVSCITRLVSQKSPELIKAAIYHVLERGGQFILLGSISDPHYQEEFLDLKNEMMVSPHVHIELVYHEGLSHAVYAASDLFIVPSLFEPCGLTQLIAMRYGTVPLVRETGGLKDTVWDVDFSEKEFSQRNGYTFQEPNKKELNETLDRALKCWFDHPQQWKKIVNNCIHMDFSWEKSTEKYCELYNHVCSEKVNS